jgi:hypothetical protein
MLEQRVTRLEEQMSYIRLALERLEPKIMEAAAVRSDLAEIRTKDIADIRSRLAFLEGRILGMPATWQLVTIVLTTWSVGTALIFAMLSFLRQ